MRFLPLLIILLMVCGCKTSEENYRAAYEKAIAGRDSAMAFDSTIYGRHRRNINARLVADAKGDTVEVRSMYLKVTADGGGIPEWLKMWSVVVGQFKTATNARSLRERLSDAGYARAFVVENSEPYYFVVLQSCPSEEEALKVISDLDRSKFPVPLKTPLPFIIKIGRGR